MDKRRVLLLAANNQSFTNVKLLSNSLSNCEFFWLDLSSIFHQTLTSPEFDHERLEINIKSKRPFYLQNFVSKLKILKKVKKQFKKKEKYDLIILGDLGIIEYNLLKYAFDGSSIFIQDAILLWSEKFQFMKRVRSVFYSGARQNICDTIICSGEATKNTLVSEGVSPSKIKAIGIPRFMEYNRFEPFNRRSNKLPTYIFIGEAYSWHGLNDMDDEQNKILKKLDKIQADNKDKFRLLVRKHPRDSNDYQFTNLEVIDPNKLSVKENILQADYVINYGYPSTILFEAAKLNVLTLLIKSKSLNYERMTNYLDFKKIALLKDLNDLENSLLNLNSEILNPPAGIINIFIASNENYDNSLAQVLQ